LRHLLRPFDVALDNLAALVDDYDLELKDIQINSFDGHGHF
jgi:hypothetical protein